MTSGREDPRYRWAASVPCRPRLAEQRSIGSRSGCRWRRCSLSIRSLRPAKKPRSGRYWMRKARVKSTQVRSGSMDVHADKQTIGSFAFNNRFRQLVDASFAPPSPLSFLHHIGSLSRSSVLVLGFSTAS
ncbi:hypothetical protein D9619_013692 [Psilocybe cf. subviscida]|uniref:Uncharacterized protein n=1 Tax=Psilocybe cf. subviscida TaxID=2480587 RepID=A0A8H5AZL2_9AGAR|nr:hypothetical protein D9619_013692 [Psilocybe cf. subviscida]